MLEVFRASISVWGNFLFILHEKTYFFYFTHPLLQNTHISLSILHIYSIKYSLFYNVLLFTPSLPLSLTDPQPPSPPSSAPSHHYHHHQKPKAIKSDNTGLKIPQSPLERPNSTMKIKLKPTTNFTNQPFQTHSFSLFSILSIRFDLALDLRTREAKTMRELNLGVDKIEALKEMGVRSTSLLWARENESFVSVVLMLAKQISQSQFASFLHLR